MSNRVERLVHQKLQRYNRKGCICESSAEKAEKAGALGSLWQLGTEIEEVAVVAAAAVEDL